VNSKYIEEKNLAYKYYRKIGKVYNPYLRTNVIFNSKGFWHMIYTSRNNKRSEKNQMLRFNLLKKSAKIIALSHTLQEYEKSQKIEYFGFIAIINDWKIKVIVKKAENGKPYFLSNIPNWRTNYKRDRLLHKGDMEKD